MFPKNVPPLTDGTEDSRVPLPKIQNLPRLHMWRHPETATDDSSGDESSYLGGDDGDSDHTKDAGKGSPPPKPDSDEDYSAQAAVPASKKRKPSGGATKQPQSKKRKPNKAALQAHTETQHHTWNIDFDSKEYKQPVHVDSYTPREQRRCGELMQEALNRDNYMGETRFVYVAEQLTAEGTSRSSDGVRNWWNRTGRVMFDGMDALKSNGQRRKLQTSIRLSKKLKDAMVLNMDSEEDSGYLAE